MQLKAETEPKISNNNINSPEHLKQASGVKEKNDVIEINWTNNHPISVNSPPANHPISVSVPPAKHPISINVPSAPSKEVNLRDGATFIIAIIAVLGFLYNIATHRRTVRDRLSTQKKENLTLVLKEIVLPDYIQPILSDLKSLSIELQLSKDKNSFIKIQKLWKDKKHNIRRLAVSGAKISAFKSAFSQTLNKLHNVEDCLATLAYIKEDIQGSDDTISDCFDFNQDPFLEVQDCLVNWILDLN